MHWSTLVLTPITPFGSALVRLKDGRTLDTNFKQQDCRLGHKVLPNFDYCLLSLLLGILAPILLFPEYFCIFQLVSA